MCYWISLDTSPLKNRFNSDWRILHPFPALIALILPDRIYFKKVGLEIFKYSIASSVVKTTSFSIKDIELPPFVLIFAYLSKIYAERVLNVVQFDNYWIFKLDQVFLEGSNTCGSQIRNDKLS